MSIQICRIVELLMRSAYCDALRSKLPLHRRVLGHVGSSGHSAPVLKAVQTRAYSLDRLSSQPQQPCTERLCSSSARIQRKLSAAAVQGRPLSLGSKRSKKSFEYNSLDTGAIEEYVRHNPKGTAKEVRHFIINPDLANIVAQHLGPHIKDSKTVLFDCNPWPGLLTRTLLKAGAQRVVALEGDKSCVHNLQDLEHRLDGRLKVVYCNYFKLDRFENKNDTPAIISSDKLFTELGISKANWTDDVPVKVFGFVPYKKSSSHMCKILYALLEQESVYRFGRIELNLFISEQEYQRLMRYPGNMQNYKPFSVLWQIACDIQLLHKEPWDSFILSPNQDAAVPRRKPDHLCLVRLRPRADLFSSGLTPSNAPVMAMMVKQCLARRKIKLIDKLNALFPDSASKQWLSELGLPQNILTGDVCPGDYLRLFQLMVKSQEIRENWLYEEFLITQREY